MGVKTRSTSNMDNDWWVSVSSSGKLKWMEEECQSLMACRDIGIPRYDGFCSDPRRKSEKKSEYIFMRSIAFSILLNCNRFRNWTYFHPVIQVKYTNRAENSLLYLDLFDWTNKQGGQIAAYRFAMILYWKGWTSRRNPQKKLLEKETIRAKKQPISTWIYPTWEATVTVTVKTSARKKSQPGIQTNSCRITSMFA